MVGPPSELLQPCPAPVGKAATNEDIAEWLMEYKSALRSCDADKTSLREWREGAIDGGAGIGADTKPKK